VRLKLVLPMCCALLAACSTNETLDTSNPDSFLAYLSQGQNKEVLNSIVSNQPQWFAVLESIESGVKNGDAVWLNIAAKLHEVSDAGASLALNYSVSRGLPYEPELVLSGVDLGFRLERLCTIPFIEEEQSVVDSFVSGAKLKLNELVLEGEGRAEECVKLITSIGSQN